MPVTQDRSESRVVSFWLPDFLVENLDSLASIRGVSRNLLVREALMSHVASEIAPGPA